MSTDERVLLFKNPAGGQKYAQALLNILCAPPHVVIKITTYNKEWVPEQILDNSSTLNKREALVVCVDAEQDVDGKWWIKNYYPIREVKIQTSEMHGDYLELAVEVLGYIRCDDYAKYTLDIKKELKVLPPAQKSYIAYDRLRNLQIIDYTDENAQEYEATWQRIATTLANLKIYDKVAFYTLSGIQQKDNNKKLKIENDNKAKNEYLFVYKLFENKRYSLILSHLLPFHNKRGKIDRLNLEVSMPKNIELEKADKLEICGRQEYQNIDVIVNSIASSSYGTIEIKPEDPTVKFSPILYIPIKLSLTPIWKRHWKRATLIIPAVALALVYAYFQLVQNSKSFPNFQVLFTGSPESIAATASAIILIIIPIIITQVLKGKKEE